ncbi:MAG: tetratricopeptide repeat protein [Bacteroidota bacterium]|nr:tetratricopeptide repeat protein [Bacteroidota bacterium]
MNKLLILIFVSVCFSLNAQVSPEDSLTTVIKDPRSSKKIKGESALQLGEIYFSKNRLAEALENFHLSLKYAVEINDIRLKANCVNNIGIIYNRNGNLTKCISYIEECLKLRLQINDSSGLALTYNNLGFFYQLKGDYKNAPGLIIKAVQIQEKINDKQGLGYSLQNLSKVYYHNGDLDSAFIFVARSLKTREEVNDKRGIAESLVEMAKIKLDKKEYAESEKYAYRALSIAKETKHITTTRGAAEILYKLYKSKNNLAGALQMHELFVLMKDSFSNERNRKSSLQKELQIAYDKKLATDSIKQQEANKVKDAQIMAQESELKQEKTMKFVLYGGSILLLLFGGFMFNRFKVTSKQKNIIENQQKLTEIQNALLAEKQKEILDSITYAENIQRTLIANHDFVNQTLPDSFVLYQPKAIVSGDFYWATSASSNQTFEVFGSKIMLAPTKERELFYLAVCDSTGHGVPGAFMSLLNISFLNEAIKEKNIRDPSKVFDHVRERLIDSISKGGRRDGMDGILLCFDLKNQMIYYVASNNAPVVISDGQLKHLPMDKMPVGSGEIEEPFKLFNVSYKKGDMLYLYTDGYADQFGGPQGKKFKYRQLSELLIEISPLPLSNQKSKLEQRFLGWKGELEQVDDVCVLGIRL